MTKYQSLVLLCNEELLKGDGANVQAASLMELNRKTALAKKQTAAIQEELLARLRKMFGV